MKYFVYQLAAGGYVNRFLTTGTYTQAQEFERVVLSGTINEWLEKGFSIYENPCRKEFINRRKEQIPEYIETDGEGNQECTVFGETKSFVPYFPFGNQGVDFSEFYFNPTYLRCYSYALVLAEQEETARFELETCGGITLWLNGELVTDFIPFTRNKKQTCPVTLHLKQGFNKILVCLDDLAERDTDFYFRMRYEGNGRLKLCLPVDDEVDVETMDKVEQALSQIYFDRETYISEPVVLNLKNPLDRNLCVQITYKPVTDKISHAEKLVCHETLELKPGANTLTLFDGGSVIPGFYTIRVKAGVDGIWAERSIAVQVFRRELLEQKEATVKARKAQAIRYLAEYEVENVYKAAAILAAGGDEKQAESIILEELEGVWARKDCSDFHLIVVLQIWKLFGERLSEQTRLAIRGVILGFRYWIDEPGDDVMWFFSENHALLFHICQYYAGKLFPDECFTNSGWTGREQEKRAEELLDEWFDGFFKEFITEWNSNAYIPVDVLGLCGLYNLADEESRWRDLAGRALDALFYDMAVNEHKGAVMTTFGRSYEKESKGNYAAGTTALLYIGYGAGCLNRAALAYISLILGDYEPPKEYQTYIGLTGRQKLIYEKTQGYKEHVNLYLYKDARVQLSTAVAFHPFTPGYQEHIMQATLDPTAQMYVSHPGEVQPYGSGRPNYWAGNGSLPLAAQYENLGIMVYHIPEDHPVAFTHVYAPLMEFSTYVGTKDTLAAEKDGGYIGVRALNGLLPQQEGPCLGREFISPGRDNVWLVKVGTREEYPSLEQFFEELEQTEILWEKGDRVRVTDRRFGLLELSKEKFTVDGKPVYHYPVSWKGIVTWEGEKEHAESEHTESEHTE